MMKFLAIYHDYQGEEVDCEWVEAESEEHALERGAFLYDNWANYILIPENLVQVVRQKIVDCLLELEEEEDRGEQEESLSEGRSPGSEGSGG